MLLNARRIVFEPEFKLPNYTFETLYRVKKEEPLLNKNGQFFVHLSEKTPYLREMVRQAQDNNLTVSGDGTAPVKGGDITEARKGDIISFGSSSRFDMNWIKRDQYACKKGVAPVYDAVKDWNKIEKAIKQFADQKKTLRTLDGQEIRFHSRFMVVDGRVIPYEKNQINILIPATVLRDIVLEFDIYAVKVVRNY